LNYYQEKEIDFSEKILKKCLNNVIKLSLIEGSEDDLTIILVCLKNPY